MRLGVITSMKKGLEHFVYREMCDLADRGVSVSLFPTKHGPGLYGPRPEWSLHRWRWWMVLISQPARFLRMPIQYLAILWEAIRYGATVDFLLASYFAAKMADADLIYATFGDRKLFVGHFCKRITGKPLTVAIHAYELYGNPNPKLFPVALAACDQIIAVTEHNREILCVRYAVPSNKVKVVRLSVDLTEYRPSKKFVVLIVAFFVEKKGHEILFEAVQQMGREDVEVWVVGGSGGASREVDVRAMANKFNLESQVAFFGKLSGTALKAVYHACDVFCLPSRVDRYGDSEGFPTVIIEAMACGKPVVTTRHVEIPKIVERIVVDENDVTALADALERVYQSSALRQELGKRNRELAEIHFSSRNIATKLRLFEEIARTSPADSVQPEVTNGDAQHSSEFVAKAPRIPQEQLT